MAPKSAPSLRKRRSALARLKAEPSPPLERRAAPSLANPGSTPLLPMRGFAQSLPMALLRAREAVMRRFRPGLRSRGVTEQQWRVVRALAHSGPMEVTALAEATFLLAPSLSCILPDLETRGLISRRQSDSDRRRAVVSLQPKGRELIAAHAPDSEEIYDEIARTFGQERLDQLFKLLRELEETLGQTAP